MHWVVLLKELHRILVNRVSYKVLVELVGWLSNIRVGVFLNFLQLGVDELSR